MGGPEYTVVLVVDVVDVLDVDVLVVDELVVDELVVGVSVEVGDAVLGREHAASATAPSRAAITVRVVGSERTFLTGPFSQTIHM